MLDAVSPFWRHTTAPYGPTFLGVASLISAAVGSHLIAGVLLLRAVELAGVVLLAIFVPRLARLLGADPARAVWLAVISPLVLLELIAAGHNDALMAGLLVAGVTLALERRPLLGIAICALAATVKVPAAAGIVFIALSWWRAEPQRAARIAVAEHAGRSGSIRRASRRHRARSRLDLEVSLSTPAKVRLAITPSTALGYSIASVLHALGVSVSSKAIEHAVSAVTLGVTAAARARALLPRPRREPRLCLAVLLLASVIGGPAAWPWYLIWGMALAACCPAGATLALAAARPDRGHVVPGQGRRAARAAAPDRAGDARDLCAGGRARMAAGDAAEGAWNCGVRAMSTATMHTASHAGEAAAAATAGVRGLRGGCRSPFQRALAAVLVLYELSTRSLWLDESATVSITSQHGSALWDAIAHDGGNMLGYYLFLHVLIGVFGDAPAVIRAPSAVATVGTVALVCLIARRMLDRRAALAAGLLTAVSLPLVFWGQDARGVRADDDVHRCIVSRVDRADRGPDVEARTGLRTSQ